MDDSGYRAPKAYHNKEFLDDLEARPIRILSEYIEPKKRFDRLRIKDTILFFGSARIPSRDQAAADLEAARGAATGAPPSKDSDSDDIARAEIRLEMSRYYEDTRELAKRLTLWSKELKGGGRRFVICSGGGPGIMEAANRGASEAKGENIGLCISLPNEQGGNGYITRQLSFMFHYFFMRKFWFLYMAKAMVIMPGGFGTLDELAEALTLIQTMKMKKKMPIVLYGTEYWKQVINFEPMVKYGMINAEDVELFYPTDSIDDAFDFITTELRAHAIDSPGESL
jgi:uncharacterized protein (TIGR00730 family)